jgi:glycosyltransferase involved in cell wall biosynthesis
MRVALITDGIYPYVIGGMQRHSFYLAKYLAKHNVYVDLFHFNNSELDINKLDCFNDDEKEFIHSIVIPFPESQKFPGHYIYNSYRYSNLIFEKIKSSVNEYDFIYTKGFTGWKLILEKEKGLPCPNIGINFHGYEMFQDTAKNILAVMKKIIMNYFAKKVINKSDYVFSYGGKITDILINKAIHFLFVGRYDERKGLKELNIVLKNLIIDKNYEFKFSFIGPIVNNKKIVNKNIEYFGELRNDSAIKEHLKNADVLVCPSYSEGMPNVIIEAMANKMAIIASNVGAINLLVNEENGFLISPRNTEDLKFAILNYIKIDKESLSIQQNISFLKIKDYFLWDKIIISTISEIKKKIEQFK